MLNASANVEPDLRGVAVTSMSNVTGGTSVTFLVDLDVGTMLSMAELSEAFLDGLIRNDTVDPDSIIKTDEAPRVEEPGQNNR